MSHKKPFRRNVRQFMDGMYADGGKRGYIFHEYYADSPEHFIRAYLIILKDFLTLLDYIEPADKNLNTYSYRIHELLLRVCIEIEANFVAILSENGYAKKGNWSMTDYKKINKTHRLSSYVVKLPVWKGENNTRRPFKNWEMDKRLVWYHAYNITKHNRHSEFENATFENLTNAICGLIVVLSSQFMDIEFSPSDNILLACGPSDGLELTIGNYFTIKYPEDWEAHEKYDFDWQKLSKETNNPIEKINYK